MQPLHQRLDDVKLVRELYFTRKAWNMSAVSIARKFEINVRTLYSWINLSDVDIRALEQRRKQEYGIHSN